MDDLKEISDQRLEMLLEAMEILEDMRIYMALFNKQHYSQLKNRVTLHTRQTYVLKLKEDD